MRLIGLDLSLTTTGYAASTDKVEFGTIEPKGRRGHERLEWIWQQIRDVCVGADLVILEDFAFARPNQAHQIGMLHGVIRHALWRGGVPFITIPPTRLKKFATGKGNSEKSIIIREVWKRWEHNASDDNEADAITLVYIGRSLVGDWEPTADFQREVVGEVLQAHDWLREQVRVLREKSETQPCHTTE